MQQRTQCRSETGGRLRPRLYSSLNNGFMTRKQKPFSRAKAAVFAPMFIQTDSKAKAKASCYPYDTR
jgi:hypothetical protein